MNICVLVLDDGSISVSAAILDTLGTANELAAAANSTRASERARSASGAAIPHLPEPRYVRPPELRPAAVSDDGHQCPTAQGPRPPRNALDAALARHRCGGCGSYAPLGRSPANCRSGLGVHRDSSWLPAAATLRRRLTRAT